MLKEVDGLFTLLSIALDDDEQGPDWLTTEDFDVPIEDAGLDVEALVELDDDRLGHVVTVVDQLEELLVILKVVQIEGLEGINSGQGATDELPGQLFFWPQEDILEGALFDDLTVFHHGDLVSHPLNGVHLVGDQDDGQSDLLVETLQEVEDLVGILGVQG